MTILILAEHDNKNLNPNTRNVVTAASKIGGDIHVLILGNGDLQNIANSASKISGVGKVLVSANPAFEHFLSEALAPAIKEISGNYNYILAPATTFGKDILPRISALLDVQQISEITEVIDKQTFKRPIYAGNVIATIKTSEAKNIITIRCSNFDKAAEAGNAPIENINLSASNNLTSFVQIQKTESARPELTSARIVVSGGRGVGSGENFKIIEALADKLNAAVGASRAAVDAGFVPNDYQVGQTGKIVAPELYVAVGISGAIQHLAGMKESKIIVAINKDENAPIFEVADFGLVADLFQAVPELTSKL
ncbi:MAG: FAD-binding protein [Rickettsiales bacterium]|nr:FAD-binding protein [Rickettsiales bacterium]